MPVFLGGPELLLMVFGGFLAGIYLAVRLARRSRPPNDGN